ncbi:hypothetical protein [Luteimonas sp. e5]
MRLVPVYRVSVCVPAAQAAALRAAILAADRLEAGGYSEGLWWMPQVVEQFRASETAQAAHGAPGELQQVDSVRIEFMLPREEARLRRILEQGVFPHHPWRVPAVFVDETRLALAGDAA